MVQLRLQIATVTMASTGRVTLLGNVMLIEMTLELLEKLVELINA